MTSTSVRLRIWGATREYRFATPQIRTMALSYENDHLPSLRCGMMDRVPSIKDCFDISLHSEDVAGP